MAKRKIIKGIRNVPPELAIMCVVITALLGTFYPKGTMLITDVLVWVSGTITLCVVVIPLLLGNLKNQSKSFRG